MFVRSTVALMFTSPPTPLLEDSILPKDKVPVKLPDGESMEAFLYQSRKLARCRHQRC